MVLLPPWPNLWYYKTTSYETVIYLVQIMIIFLIWLISVIRFDL